MKKLFVLALMCVMALSMNAQRCAVLEFKAGVGISQADVDGISAIFITYFRPAGYTMVERTQIDKAIDEQGFQRSKMTESQMVRIGEILNVSKIVVGDINVVMGQYNVDVRVINVESGTIAATEGAAFDGTSYRTTMRSIATKLASKIEIKSSPSQSLSTGASHIAKTESEFVDLGLPSGTLWKIQNESGKYKYNAAMHMFDGQIPSIEQWEELIEYCQWEEMLYQTKKTWPDGAVSSTWTCGFDVKGKNGNTIKILDEDYHFDLTSKRKDAYYWSSSNIGSNVSIVCLYASSSEPSINSASVNDKLCVILVKKP